MENEKNYQLLDQFVGMKSEVHFHSLVKGIISATYMYQSFNFEVNLDDGLIYLQDDMDSEASTYIQLDNIKEIKHLHSDSIYDDVVSLVTDEYIIDVCTLEEPTKYPKCFRCGSEIHVPEETPWRVYGQEGYFNPYDGKVDIVNGLDFCGKCVQEFVGNIDSYIN